MSVQPSAAKPRSAAFGVVGLCVLGAACLALLVSLYGRLFGPSTHVILGIAGFLLTVAAWTVAQRIFLPAHPKGLAERWPSLCGLQKPTARAATVLKLAAAISILTTLLTARLDGVASGGSPVFAAREHYELNTHGKKTPVSRIRYCTIGASFALGWHLGAIFAAVWAMRVFMLGELASQTKSADAKSTH